MSLPYIYKSFLCSGANAITGAFPKVLVISALIALLPLPALSASHSGRSRHAHSIRKVQYGVASWYGAELQGRLMACGWPFNDHALVAAHRTLPLGTKVKVTNLRNGRSVVVKIEDRGPFVHSRLIDLSRAAASHLGFVHRGITPVKLRVVSVPKGPQKSKEAWLASRELADAQFDNNLH